MKSAVEYRTEHNKLMEDWAKEVREWTNCDDAIFYKDGIFDPDEWFANEVFRPLFILKEPYEKDEKKAKAEAVKHGNENTINFVGMGEKYGSDPWEGVGMWGKVTTVADIIKNNTVNIGDDGNLERTHQDICREIAVINLKKIGGGRFANSEKSLDTLHYSCHAKRFEEKVRDQIEKISPTIIVCCGNFGEIKKILKITEEIDSRYKSCKAYGTFVSGKSVVVLDMYHPSQTRLKSDVVKEELRLVCEIIKNCVR